MPIARVDIAPRSAFGTLPKGDTFFGQLCWMIRNRHGDARLRQLLEGYTAGKPFAVVSDAFPRGYLPRPVLPGRWFKPLPDEDRKAAKKRVWLPEERINEPVADLLRYCRKEDEVEVGVSRVGSQPHNSIDRRTGTTGERFAPYAMTQYWYGHWDGVRGHYIEPRLSVYVVFDEQRITPDEIGEVFFDIGVVGFGRDASIGLGKFEVETVSDARFTSQSDANAWLTLAPCAPQGLDLDPKCCFYQVFTRFGRHGDAAVYTGKPFKTPVLLAQTGAVLTPKQFREGSFVGSGLGGDGSLSEVIPETVHQGYAPVIGIHLTGPKEAEHGNL